MEASSEEAAPEGAEVEDQTDDDDDCEEGLESEEAEEEETEGEDAASPGREEGTEVEASSEEAAPEGSKVEDNTEDDNGCQQGWKNESAEMEETEAGDAASPVLEEEQAAVKTFVLPNSPEARKTALWEAAGAGDVDIVERLLVAGVEVDFSGNPQGDSPLTQAAFNGHEEVVKSLLAHDANVEWVDQDAFGALHNAAYNGHVNVVKLLISPPFYANVHARNKRLELPIDLTVDENIKKVLRQERLRRSVFEAVSDRHAESVETLLESGARCDFKDIKGSTALHIGARLGCGRILKMLLSHGAHVEASVVDTKWRPLHFAAQQGHLDALVALLQGGAKVESHDFEGRTPLHLAAERGQLTVCQELLAHRARAEAIDAAGATALHLAAGSCHADVALIRALIVGKAQVSTSDAKGNLPLHLAASAGRMDVVAMLLSYEFQSPLDAKNQEGMIPEELASDSVSVHVHELVRVCVRDTHNTHTHTHTHTHTLSLSLSKARMHARPPTHTQTRTQTQTQTDARTQTHPDTHTHIRDRHT